MASTAGIRAGKAFVLIEAVDRTGKVLGAIKNRIGRFAADMSTIGQTMALRAAAALTPVGFSLSTYTKFDDAMRRVQARSQGTGQEMQNLRTQAKELGRTTAFTASHIAELQARLAQFGMSRADIAAAVEPIMLLARSGGSGLELGTDIMQATDAVTQVLSAYKMSTAETANVADLLTTTVNSSKFGLEELSTALQHAAPTAATFNVPLKETIAVLAAFRELGYDSSIVGTAFRNMMLRTARSEGQDKFNQTLFETTGRMIDFTDASGNMMGPLHILMQLNDTLEGLGNAQAADMIAKLMELRATGPVLGGKEQAETLARLMTALDNASGVAKRTHDEMESGIGGGFRELESAFEGVQIALGEMLDTMMVGVSRITTQYLGSVTSWITANQGYVIMTVAAIAAVGALGVALIGLGQLLMMTTSIFSGAVIITGALTTAFAALMSILNPAAPTILALIAVFSAYIYAQRGAISELASEARKVATELANEASSTAGAMAAALSAGEIELAFQIVIKNLEIYWHRFLNWFKKQIKGMSFDWKDMLGLDAIDRAALEMLTHQIDKHSDDPIIRRQAQLKDLEAERDRLQRKVDSGRGDSWEFTTEGEGWWGRKLVQRQAKELLGRVKGEIDRLKAEIEDPSLIPWQEQQTKEQVPVIDEEADSREAEIENLENELLRLKRQAKLKAWLAERAREQGKDVPPTDNSAWLQRLNALGAAIGSLKTPAALAKSNVAPDVVEGVRRGSMEAARVIQQARYSEKSEMQRLIEEAVKSGDTLEEIRDKLDELAVGEI